MAASKITKRPLKKCCFCHHAQRTAGTFRDHVNDCFLCFKLIFIGSVVARVSMIKKSLLLLRTFIR